MIAVDVIETLLTLVDRDQRVRLLCRHDRPAHVRDLEARIAAGIQPLHVGLDPAEPCRRPLLAPTAEQLHAEAYSEQRRLPLQGDMVEGLTPAGVERRHAGVKSSHTRNHQPAAFRGFERVRDDLRGRVDPFEHAEHGFDVADPAIDDRDVHDQAAPNKSN